MRVDVWEAAIWCMSVGVKADRMRILIILVLSMWPINHINACDAVYFCNQYYSV